MNPGGIRANVPAGELTYGHLYRAQPFNNDLVLMELSGAQIELLLEQQWEGQPFPRILKTSGISYTWDRSAPVGDRVSLAGIRIGDQPLSPTASYAVVVNSFLAEGGDNFTVLREGANRTVGPVDLDAFIKYVTGLPQPIAARVEGRIP